MVKLEGRCVHGLGWIGFLFFGRIPKLRLVGLATHTTRNFGFSDEIFADAKKIIRKSNLSRWFTWRREKVAMPTLFLYFVAQTMSIPTHFSEGRERLVLISQWYYNKSTVGIGLSPDDITIEIRK